MIQTNHMTNTVRRALGWGLQDTELRIRRDASRPNPTGSDDLTGVINGRSDHEDTGLMTDNERATIETDGGQVDENTAVLQTYANDDSHTRLAYPTDRTIERDPNGGATFEAPHPGAADVAVFVDEHIGATPRASAAAFLTELDADEHVYTLELVTQKDTQLESGQTGQLLECAYIGDSCDQWRLAYLFVLNAGTGYTLGIDWNDTAEFGATVTTIIDSFALGAT